MTGPAAPADEFESHRHHLFGVAYRMLGSVADAEDVVQEAWLRWVQADEATIRSPRGWLTTATTRLSIDRLRSAQHRRETYVGPWLPEPLLVENDDPAEHVELAESLSLAFLTLLERLDPVQRAAFLLREVFGEDYRDVAAVVNRSEEACRQIVHRAKERLGPDRPTRFDPGLAEAQRLVDSFLGAAFVGDLGGLHSVLADDVVAWSDGGSEQRAARRPVVGVDRVARFVCGIATRPERSAAQLEVRHVRLNGEAGIVMSLDGEVFMALAFEFSPAGISGLRSILNPRKLDHLRGAGLR